MAKIKMEFKCEKCGKSQPRNEKESNENWDVYDSNQKCECGGEFARFINGRRISN